jgi:3-methyladenine DNA glycosylase AlkD
MNEQEVRHAITTLPRTSFLSFTVAVNASKETVLGVKVPSLRAFAHQIAGDTDPSSWPIGESFELDLIHEEIVLAQEKNERKRYQFAALFLAKTDGWALVDNLASQFKIKDLDLAYSMSQRFAHSPHLWVRRFAYSHLITSAKNLSAEHLMSLVVLNEAVDVQKAEAWLLAEGLIYHDEALRNFLSHCPDRALVNRTIQKAVESFRISDAQKALLRKLKR